MLRLLTIALLTLAAPASAERWRATYAITAAGITVMDAEVIFTLGSGGNAGASQAYSIETRVRSRGVATMLFRGAGHTRAEGVWQGATLRPTIYHSTGNWNGTPRLTRLEYADGALRVATLEPAEDMERTPVSVEERRAAIDSLSAMVQLTDNVRRTARCDTQARTFDGRRLVQFDVTTDPVLRVADRGLLRCVVESRALGGFPTDRPIEEVTRPVRSVVIFGVPQAGAPAIPVQVEIASRWWGTIRASLNEISSAN